MDGVTILSDATPSFSLFVTIFGNLPPPVTSFLNDPLRVNPNVQ